jgi:hypothetical protein
MYDLSQVSPRMRDMIASIMPKIDVAILNRASSIDLATAENWLLRPELEEIYKSALQASISSQVCTISSQRA